MVDDPRQGLFSALLRHWRTRRGLSQLDLALAADVSSRHVSFLETGRSSPSPGMVLRLAAVLDVPLRQVNAMLQAAGHPPAYPEPSPAEGMPDTVDHALRLMKNLHEPYPLMIIDKAYELVDVNESARRLLSSVMPVSPDSPSPNLVRATFADPGVRQALINFDEVGQALLLRLQREVLADPNDGRLRGLLDEVLASNQIPADWREPDLSQPSSPALLVHLAVGDRALRFIAMITALQAPQLVALDELRIETWFPADPETAEACTQLAADA